MAITMDPKSNKLAENVILKFKNLKVTLKLVPTRYYDSLIAAKRPFPLLFKKRIKPLTPRSDQHETSLCNSFTLYRKQRMRICKLIR